jgi:tetratricopeptide (TPR) repeat protein
MGQAFGRAAAALALSVMAAGTAAEPDGAGPIPEPRAAERAAAPDAVERTSGPDGIARAYLVARHAALTSDYALAAENYASVVARDPGNADVLESAMSAYLNAGQASRAADIARGMRDAGGGSQIAMMALVVDHAAHGRWDAILEARASGREIGPLIDALTEGWARLGRGDEKGALAAFDSLAAAEGLSPFGRLHGALARAALGDWDGAELLFAGRDGTGARIADPIRLNRRTALLRAVILSRQGRHEHAVALLDHLFGERPDPGVAALRAALATGEDVPYTGPRDAREGVAEAFYTVAAALRGDAANGYVLLYAQSASALADEHGDAALLSAKLLRGLRRNEEAEERFAAVGPEHPAHVEARMGLAASLRGRGRGEEAVAVLDALGARHPDTPRLQTALGDALRGEGRLAEARSAYDRALAVHDDPTEAPWTLHYARAVTREGLGDWSGARADLGRALAVEPDEPRLLHHLGAAMVERGEPMDEALALIERAVEASPEDGAMTGSLGLALYRMGRIDEAVEQLERAVALTPLDPALNDHLGDALWSVDRRREARFQWQRALTLEPGRDGAALLRHKLAHGLVAALEPRADAVTLAADR